MKQLLKKITTGISDFFYEISCKIYHVKPVRNKRRVSAYVSKKKKDLRFYCLMMAIPLLQFCIMWIGVNANSILLSFKEYDLNMNVTWTLNNFKMVIQNFFEDEYLRASLFNSVKFYLINFVVTLPVSMLISFYFYKKFALARPLKIILFLPSVIAGVVAITVFYYLADRGWPLLVELFTGKEDVMGLLVNTETRTTTILAYNIFYSLAGNFLFYSSAMSGIDDSISEASQIDGAGMLQEFWYITIPSIFPTFKTFLVSGIAGILIGDYGMYAFSKVSGGAAVPTMGYYFTSGIMEDTTHVKYPYFAALGIVLSIMTCIIVFTVRALMNRFDPYEKDVQDTKKQKRRRA